MPDHVEFPRPLRLLATISWSLTESAGLPVGALALGAWLYGRDAGLLAGLAATWLVALIRKIATGSVPSLLTITAVVLTLQTVMVLATGQLWIYLLQFPAANLVMSFLFARTARGPHPLVAKLAAEVVALRQPAMHHPGLHRFFQGATWLWAGIFLLRATGGVHGLLDGGHRGPDRGRHRRLGAVVPVRAAPLRPARPLRGQLAQGHRLSVGLSSSSRASSPFTKAGEPSVDRSLASWTASLIATGSGTWSCQSSS